MSKIGEEGRDSLRTLEALAGADYVREKLIATLTIGPKDFSKRIYAIKCRVKSEKRLEDKIENRRIKKPEYTALDATDIVGLRLICIFSDELPGMVSSFLDYVEFMQDPRIGLFSGSKLADAISEVVVYASRSNSSVYKSIFDNLNFKFSDQVNQGRMKVTLENPTDQHPYSSIHIICKANSYYSEYPKQIPIEVQIRTAFEDIWSEIEHPRGYKGPDFSERYRTNPVLHQIANNISKRLVGLKATLEACAQQAEDIGSDFNILDQKPKVEEGLSAAKQSNRRVAQERLIRDDAPSDLIARLIGIENEFSKLYGRIASEKRAEANTEVFQVVKSLNDGISELESISEAYKTVAHDKFKADAEFLYYRYSEVGLAHYWISRLLKGFLEPNAPESAPDGSIMPTVGNLNSDRHLDRALEAYFALQISHDGSDALLSFRIANALALQGHAQLALEKCKEAYAALEGDTRLPEGDVFRAVIPRAYGDALWRYAQRLRASVERGQPGSFDGKARAAIQEAIQISIKARDTFLPSLAQQDRAAEEVRYQNNILMFMSTYAELNGVLTDFGQLGVRERLLRDVNELYGKATRVSARLDTCVRAYLVLGEFDKARECAIALRISLDRVDLVRHYRPEDISYMHETVRLGGGVEQ